MTVEGKRQDLEEQGVPATGTSLVQLCDFSDKLPSFSYCLALVLVEKKIET